VRAIALIVLLVCAAAVHAQDPSRLEVLLRADVGRGSDDPDVTCDDLLQPPQQRPLVILGSDKDLASAEARARAISRRTGAVFSNEGYYLDRATKQAYYHRQHDGEYIPRWQACEASELCITIELSSGYAQLAPNLYIVVGAAGSEVTRAAVARYRKVVPDSYVKRSTLAYDKGLYSGVTSGCQPWDLLVLARTERFEEAVAIARELGQRTRIRYDERPLSPLHWDESVVRKPPFPHLFVGRDSHYGSAGDDAHFLVIGAEFGYPENAPEALLERFKGVVPGAYRMKRADPMCGL
jgi:hypothetical protein